MICEPWDVVAVPFPFSDGGGSKRRPALVLSRRGFNERGRAVLAMITTKLDPAWPGDVLIEDLQPVALRHRCIVRLKLFTLDSRLILRRTGRPGEGDRGRVSSALRAHLV